MENKKQPIKINVLPPKVCHRHDCQHPCRSGIDGVISLVVAYVAKNH